MLSPCKGSGDKGTGMEDTRTRVTALGAQRRVVRWPWGRVRMCGCSSRLLHIVLCVWVSFFGGATPQFQHCLPQHDSIHVSQPQPEPGLVPLVSWVLEASPTHMEINTNTD